MSGEPVRTTSVEDLEARQARLSDAKRAVLERRLRGKLQREGNRSIPRRGDSGPIPLSSAQEQLWFIDQLTPGNASFNISAALRLEGPVNEAALRAGLDEIVARHEILRTTFAAVDGRPVQVVAPPGPVPLPVVDLSQVHPEAREEEALRLAAEESARPFDLASGPLLRMQLLRLAAEHHVLLLTVHHIVFDEWSVALFVRELTSLYSALNQAGAASLPELPIQYADFAVWQRGWLQGSARATQLDYWKRQLAGVPRMLELPTDRPRKAVQTFNGASRSIALPRPLVERLTAIGRREDATLFMVLLAAWQVLLHRYTGQDQIVVCTGVANRSHRELESLIGCLTNIVVLRGDLAGAASFREVLRHARDVTLGAFSHQSFPFEHLVQELHPDRDLSHPPFSQSMLVLLNSPSESLVVEGLRLTPIPLESTTTQYDLLLHFWEEPDGLQARLRYSTDLFDAETIGRLLGNFRTLLDAATADPDQAIGDVPMLDEDQRRTLLLEWNDTHTAFPRDMCLHELIESRIDRDPHRTAVIGPGEALTYGELDARANRVAARLRAHGVGPGIAVAIAVRRSIDSVVGLLGIARAGAHYVPLDPAYPRERLEFMLRDSGAAIVLTQSELLPLLPPFSGRYECLDVESSAGTNARAGRIRSGATPGDLAYLIYTSGSTGKPKAVMLDHRGRVNNFTDFNRRFDIGPGDRLLALASLGFDMSAYDVFGTLAAGATIVLPGVGEEREPGHWAEMIRRHGVTVWHSVPALLQMLVDRVSRGNDGTLDSLRLVLLGGDWIPVSLPERLRVVAPNARVISLGGATEVSMDSTIFSIDRVDPEWESIPYGRPMANQSAYVVDRRGHPVPVGVPGELCLGGVGVAWGYFNRPELTAEKFVPDPFCGEPGARLYCTGDLARFMPDGNLELLGRIDHQVKIRGVRIEPGEVAARLRQHPLVDDAVVMAREDVPGDRRLVAYLLARDEIGAHTALLRAFVREALPEYMVPSAFVRIDRLPLTPHGKLDRLALPAPDPANDGTDAAPQPPATPVQEAIAIVWGQVLGVSTVGVNQSFFDVGGHSLLVAQVTSRLHEIFQVDVPMRAMFLAPTVADLSQTLERLGAERGVNVGRIAELFVQVHAMSDAEAKAVLEGVRRTAAEGAAS